MTTHDYQWHTVILMKLFYKIVKACYIINICKYSSVVWSNSPYGVAMLPSPSSLHPYSGRLYSTLSVWWLIVSPDCRIIWWSALVINLIATGTNQNPSRWALRWRIWLDYSKEDSSQIWVILFCFQIEGDFDFCLLTLSLVSSSVLC